MECKNKENKMKFKSKDLILIGIFTVLLYIMSLLVAFVAIVPVGTIVSGAVYALLAAPIYMLYISKIKKPFAITITGVLCSLMGLMSFTKVSIAIITFLFFVVADIIAGAKKYESYKWNTLSYMVFSLWTLGIQGAYWYMQDFMVEFSLQTGMEQAWLDTMIKLATPLNFVIMVLATLICAYIGSLFAKILLKKHFKKAGII